MAPGQTLLITKLYRFEANIKMKARYHMHIKKKNKLAPQLVEIHGNVVYDHMSTNDLGFFGLYYPDNRSSKLMPCTALYFYTCIEVY